MSAVTPRLELRQGQSLVMTQQLQQSIKLLQLSSQELAEYIEQELEKNPLLTMEEESDATAPETEGEQDEQREIAATGDAVDAFDSPAEIDVSATDSASGDEWQGAEDEQFTSTDSNYDLPTHSRMNDDYDEERSSPPASQISLREHLINQLTVSVADPAIRMVGQHLIDLVDESGYIKDDISGLAAQLGCDDALISECFKLLHSFDPAGVCARTLRECLAIQLQDKNRLDPAMQALLEHLDLVAQGNMVQLCKLCAVDEDDIRDMCAEVRALNPRPGLLFSHETVQTVIPDVLLKRVRDGRWQVELNAAALPRVLVNRRYYSQLTGKTLDKPERKYITDQLTVANWLVKALDQRANTILKVSTEIVAQQDAFFRAGIKYLRPLTLKEVAAATDLHESTVSRVTSSKFMATPRGTFELKYFFNAALQIAGGGEGVSNRTVQFLIKELIDAEPPENPFSDDAIAEKLKERGIEIARRTISKYREIMNIPSSTLRRRKLRI